MPIIYLGKGHVCVNDAVAHLKTLDHKFTPESYADCKFIIILHLPRQSQLMSSVVRWVRGRGKLLNLCSRV